MALHAEPSDRSAAAAEFCATLGALGLTQCRVAKVFGVGARSIRRWQRGDRRIVPAIRIVFRLLAAKVITIDQVEAAAVPIPARTNGNAKEEPPAPLRAEPASDQSASASAKIATLVDPGPTTTVVEQVCALTAGACRWPLGDPRDRDFRFCGDPVVEPPYCEHHRALAYLAPRPSRGHGVRVAYGRHGRPPIPGAATGASRAPKVLVDRAGDLPGSAQPPLNREASPC
jgi:GcrA cell cycle regulator